MLMRTRAQARGLSHLMWERRLARHLQEANTDLDRVTVTVSRGMEDNRAASPLEIAVGNRLLVDATHWEKLVFNGTVVMVENLEVQRTWNGAGDGRAGIGRFR